MSGYKLVAIAILFVWNHALQAASYQITDSFGKHWFDKAPERVVVTDWALLEQLLELGIRPIGAPELQAYKQYVKQPALPEDIVDIGLRRSPSLATLRALKPDLIILGTDQKELARPFSLISRVVYYKNFSERYRSNGTKSRERFKQLAELFQRSELAKQKLIRMDQRIAQLRKQLQEHFKAQLPRVTAIRFSSPEKCLLYGDNSMPIHALTLLGFSSDLPQTSSKWGEKEIRIKELSQVDKGHLLYFEPLPDTADVLSSQNWLQLPLVQKGRAHAVSPAWSYGGAMSVLYISEAIAETLMKL